MKPLHSANQLEAHDSSSSDVEEGASQGLICFRVQKMVALGHSKGFQTLNHLNFGKHKHSLECETLLDKALLS